MSPKWDRNRGIRQHVIYWQLWAKCKCHQAIQIESVIPPTATYPLYVPSHHILTFLPPHHVKVEQEHKALSVCATFTPLTLLNTSPFVRYQQMIPKIRSPFIPFFWYQGIYHDTVFTSAPVCVTYRGSQVTPAQWDNTPAQMWRLTPTAPIHTNTSINVSFPIYCWRGSSGSFCVGVQQQLRADHCGKTNRQIQSWYPRSCQYQGCFISVNTFCRHCWYHQKLRRHLHFLCHLRRPSDSPRRSKPFNLITASSRLLSVYTLFDASVSVICTLFSVSPRLQLTTTYTTTWLF